MATLGDNIRKQYEMLQAQGISCTLEWNEGNHFTEPAIRTAKGFGWCVETVLYALKDAAMKDISKIRC